MYNKDKIMTIMQEIYDEADSIKPYVVIAQPRRNIEETPAQNFDGHIGLHIDLNAYSHGYIRTNGLHIDVARNILIENTIESGAKYLLFVDEDTVLPYYAFTKLHETAEANPNTIVTGVYYVKLASPMIMLKEKGYVYPADVAPGKLIDAYIVGLGCAFIPVGILKRMKDEEPEVPFCCIAPDGLNGRPFVGEDNFFYHRVRKMGVKILVNTDVQCLHCDLESGKYTAWEGVNLADYFTNIKITTPLTMDDKRNIDTRWITRLPKSIQVEQKMEVVE
jgi:hypothetical protein